jgi:hypothetical protein
MRHTVIHRSARVLLRFALALAPIGGRAQVAAPAALTAPDSVRDLTRLRLPLVLLGTGVEATAITTRALVTYLGVGHALEGRWGRRRFSPPVNLA